MGNNFKCIGSLRNAALASLFYNIIIHLVSLQSDMHTTGHSFKTVRI